jgi:hypothetical protein
MLYVRFTVFYLKQLFYNELIYNYMDKSKSIELILENLERHARLIRSFTTLQAERNNLALSSIEEFLDKLQNLRKALNSFDIEIKKQMPFEEDVIIKVFDTKSINKFSADHREMNEKLDIIKRLLNDETLNQKDFLNKRVEILGAINDIYTFTVEHFSQEDTRLRTKLKEIGDTQ